MYGVPKHIIFYSESDGSLCTWGNNLKGQLGIASDKPFASSIQKINKPGNFISIATGSRHSLAVPLDGSVYSWGCNFFGQLGHSISIKSFTFPQRIATLSDILLVCCGSGHSMAVNRFGVLFSWGSNHYCQCGRPNGNGQTSLCQPEVVDIPEVVIHIAAGEHHSLAVTNTGHLYAWGDNSVGQLGIPNLPGQHLPIRLDMSGVVSVACGSYTSMALLGNGSLYSWGSNALGQLGIGSYVDFMSIPQKIDFNEDGRVVQFHSQVEHSMALTSNGNLYLWGSNAFGQLGTSNQTVKSSNLPMKMKVEEEIAEIRCEDKISLVMTSSGLLNYWGKYSCGELGFWGRPHTINQFRNKKISFLHSPNDTLFRYIERWPATHTSFSKEYQDKILNLVLIIRVKYNDLQVPKDLIQKLSSTILFKLFLGVNLTTDERTSNNETTHKGSIQLYSSI